MVNPNRDPLIFIRNTVGEEEAYTRDEAMLYVFSDGYCQEDHVLDHIAVTVDTPAGVAVKYYFRHMLEDFDETAQQMIDNRFPVLLRHEPLESTIDKFQEQDETTKQIRKLPEYAK